MKGHKNKYGGQHERAASVPASSGGNTFVPAAGAIVLTLIWGAFTVFFLVHFISESLS